MPATLRPDTSFTLLEESLFAVSFDLSRLDVTGGPVPVLEGVRRAVPGTGAAQFALSRSGSLAYLPPDVTREDPRTLVLGRIAKELSSR